MLGLFNLSQMLTEEKLRELLEKYGKLKSIMLIKDRMVLRTTHTIHTSTAHSTYDMHVRPSTCSSGSLRGVWCVAVGQTGLSKGYSFAYFENVEEATTAREALNGQVIEGRQARVDYSRTNRPHSPTPGQYMGREDQRGRAGDFGYR